MKLLLLLVSFLHFTLGQTFDYTYDALIPKLTVTLPPFLGSITVTSSATEWILTCSGSTFNRNGGDPLPAEITLSTGDTVLTIGPKTENWLYLYFDIQDTLSSSSVILDIGTSNSVTYPPNVVSTWKFVRNSDLNLPTGLGAPILTFYGTSLILELGDECHLGNIVSNNGSISVTEINQNIIGLDGNLDLGTGNLHLIGKSGINLGNGGVSQTIIAGNIDFYTDLGLPASWSITVQFPSHIIASGIVNFYGPLMDGSQPGGGDLTIESQGGIRFNSTNQITKLNLTCFTPSLPVNYTNQIWIGGDTVVTSKFFVKASHFIVQAALSIPNLPDTVCAMTPQYASVLQLYPNVGTTFYWLTEACTAQGNPTSLWLAGGTYDPADSICVGSGFLNLGIRGSDQEPIIPTLPTHVNVISIECTTNSPFLIANFNLFRTLNDSDAIYLGFPSSLGNLRWFAVVAEDGSNMGPFTILNSTDYISGPFSNGGKPVYGASPSIPSIGPMQPIYQPNSSLSNEIYLEYYVGCTYNYDSVNKVLYFSIQQTTTVSSPASGQTQISPCEYVTVVSGLSSDGNGGLIYDTNSGGDPTVTIAVDGSNYGINVNLGNFLATSTNPIQIDCWKLNIDGLVDLGANLRVNANNGVYKSSQQGFKFTKSVYFNIGANVGIGWYSENDLFDGQNSPDAILTIDSVNPIISTGLVMNGTALKNIPNVYLRAAGINGCQFLLYPNVAPPVWENLGNVVVECTGYSTSSNGYAISYGIWSSSTVNNFTLKAIQTGSNGNGLYLPSGDSQLVGVDITIISSLTSTNPDGSALLAQSSSYIGATGGNLIINCTHVATAPLEAIRINNALMEMTVSSHKSVTIVADSPGSTSDIWIQNTPGGLNWLDVSTCPETIVNIYGSIHFRECGSPIVWDTGLTGSFGSGNVTFWKALTGDNFVIKSEGTNVFFKAPISVVNASFTGTVGFKELELNNVVNSIIRGTIGELVSVKGIISTPQKAEWKVGQVYVYSIAQQLAGIPMISSKDAIVKIQSGSYSDTSPIDFSTNQNGIYFGFGDVASTVSASQQVTFGPNITVFVNVWSTTSADVLIANAGLDYNNLTVVGVNKTSLQDGTWVQAFSSTNPSGIIPNVLPTTQSPYSVSFVDGSEVYLFYKSIGWTQTANVTNVVSPTATFTVPTSPSLDLAATGPPHYTMTWIKSTPTPSLGTLNLVGSCIVTVQNGNNWPSSCNVEYVAPSAVLFNRSDFFILGLKWNGVTWAEKTFVMELISGTTTTTTTTSTSLSSTTSSTTSTTSRTSTTSTKSSSSSTLSTTSSLTTSTQTTSTSSSSSSTTRTIFTSYATLPTSIGIGVAEPSVPTNSIESALPLPSSSPSIWNPSATLNIQPTNPTIGSTISFTSIVNNVQLLDVFLLQNLVISQTGTSYRWSLIQNGQLTPLAKSMGFTLSSIQLVPSPNGIVTTTFSLKPNVCNIKANCIMTIPESQNPMTIPYTIQLDVRGMTQGTGGILQYQDLLSTSTMSLSGKPVITSTKLPTSGVTFNPTSNIAYNTIINGNDIAQATALPTSSFTVLVSETVTKITIVPSVTLTSIPTPVAFQVTYEAVKDSRPLLAAQLIKVGISRVNPIKSFILVNNANVQPIGKALQFNSRIYINPNGKNGIAYLWFNGNTSILGTGTLGIEITMRWYVEAIQLKRAIPLAYIQGVQKSNFKLIGPIQSSTTTRSSQVKTTTKTMKTTTTSRIIPTNWIIAEKCAPGKHYNNPKNCCCAPGNVKTRTMTRYTTVTMKRNQVRDVTGMSSDLEDEVGGLIQRQVEPNHLCQTCPSSKPFARIVCCLPKSTTTRYKTITRTRMI